MSNPLTRSLSLRLLGIFAVTGIVVFVMLTALFTRGLGSQWQRSIKPHLAQYVNYVQQDLGDPPSPERAQHLSDNLPVNIYIYKEGEFSFSTNGATLNIRELEFDEQQPRRRHESRKLNKLAEKSHREPKREKHVRMMPDVAFDDDQRTTVLRMTNNDYTVYYELNRRKGRWRHADHLIYTLLALSAVLLLSFLAIRRQLSPIRRIQHGVGRMTLGELDHRIKIKGNDDLALLGNSIDAMAERIGAMLDAKRQLLLAISHELRSPLARARVATEMLPESINRERISDDLHDMELMITDIMESERLQQNHAVLNLQTLDLKALVNSVVETYSEPITIHLPSTTLMISADDARLRILLRNLIGNALQHGVPADSVGTHAQVDVYLNLVEKCAELVVKDQGPGIAREHLAAITEPFYRPDASRTRTTGGFGLGLTLCNLIAQAHSGSLTIESDPQIKPGTTVRVLLPLDEAS